MEILVNFVRKRNWTYEGSRVFTCKRNMSNKRHPRLPTLSHLSRSSRDIAKRCRCRRCKCRKHKDHLRCHCTRMKFVLKWMPVCCYFCPSQHRRWWDLRAATSPQSHSSLEYNLRFWIDFAATSRGSDPCDSSRWTLGAFGQRSLWLHPL